MTNGALSRRNSRAALPVARALRPLAVVVCLLVLASLPGVLAQAPEGQGNRPVPPYEAFWQAKPKWEKSSTVCLWLFDTEADGDEALAALEEATGKNAPKQTTEELASDQIDIPPALTGDAKVVATGGRWGGALALAGKGSAEGQLALRDTLQSKGACTFDAWIRPAAGAKAGTVLALPGRQDGIGLEVRWTAPGTLSLSSGADELLVHSRGVPADSWTHIALVLRASGPASLLVNGTALDTGEKVRERLALSLANLANRFCLGAGGTQDGAGFVGRVDAFRLSVRANLFYELDDPGRSDPTAARKLLDGPPFFVDKTALPLACTFDGTVKPEEFAGVSVEGATEDKDFKPGMRGSALDLTRVAKMKLAYAGADVMPMQEGSLELWFQPLDWNNFFVGDFRGTNVPWFPLLRFASQNAEAYRGLRILSIARGRNGEESSTGQAWTPLHPGHWTHLLCTWSARGAQAYIDGKPQVTSQVRFGGPITPQDAKEFEAWRKAAGSKDDGTFRLTFPASGTLLDEVRIYPRALLPEEAQNAYARFLPDASTRLAELPYIRPEYVYQYYDRQFLFRLTCLPVAGVRPVKAAVKITTPGGDKTILDRELTLDKALSAECTVATELAFGSYPVVIESKAADGKVLKSVQTQYVREQPAWWQNSLGKDRRVPKPWTAIEVKEDTLRVWGREIRLGKGGLPSAISSAGAPLLAAPPRLHGSADGQNIEMQGESLKLGEKADDRVTWDGSLTAGRLVAKVAGTLEYDGLLGLAISLESADGKPVEVKELSLDFPLRAEHAGQLIVNGGGQNFRASWDVRFVPPGDGRVWDSKNSKPAMQKGVTVGHFCPVIWLGDDDRGVCFFGENDKGWTPHPDEPAQEILRQEGQVVYRMRVISRPVTIEKPRTFVFYLHPTPTKAISPAWRGFNRQGPSEVPNYEAIDAFQGEGLTAPVGKAGGISFAVEPDSWEGAAAHAAALRVRCGKGNPALFYIDYSWPQLGPSMADYRYALWAGTGHMAWTREVEDYFTYWVNEYFRRGLIDGIYIDDTSLGATRAVYSTAYTLEDGTLQKGFNTMGFRRFLQRVWVLADQQGKRLRTVPHMTWCFEIPALSFADGCVNGEDRDIMFPAEYTYPQVWRSEELRIMGNGAKWGFVTLWKCGIDAMKNAPPGADTKAWSYWQSRAMNGWLTQHDLIPMWANELHATFTPALVKFGIDDPECRFVPDWKREGMATVTAKDGGKELLACFFIRGRQALLMVTNPAAEDREVTVSVEPAQLFAGKAPAGGVSFTDADIALRAPASRSASKMEIKAAQERSMASDPLDALKGGDAPGELATLDDPVEKENAGLLIHSKGNEVTALVRKHDFRLVLVECK